VDHIPCLKAWAASLGGITYPLLSDFWPHGRVAKKYGVLRPDGFTERAIFVLDKKGVIQYIDIHEISDQPDNEVLFAVLKQVDPSAAKVYAAIEKADAEFELPHGGVVMYCTPWCSDCRNARAWLKEHRISYTEVDISINPKAARQVREWANGNETTPTFDIDGTILVDFDAKKLADLLII